MKGNCQRGRDRTPRYCRRDWSPGGRGWRGRCSVIMSLHCQVFFPKTALSLPLFLKLIPLRGRRLRACVRPWPSVDPLVVALVNLGFNSLGKTLSSKWSLRWCRCACVCVCGWEETVLPFLVLCACATACVRPVM